MNTLQPRSLEDLFAAYRDQGDVDALGAVFDRTAQSLLLLAARVLGRSGRGTLAEDALQRTFVRAIEHRDRWDADRPLWPWLTGVLVREARKVARSEGRTPAPGRLPTPPEPLAPIDEVASAEHVTAIRHAIDALPPRLRRFVALRLVHGLSATEIANALDEPGGTVRSGLSRGMQRLREALPDSVKAGAIGALVATDGTAGGIAGIRGSVLVHARACAVPAALAAATATSTATGLGFLGPKAALVVLGGLAASSLAWGLTTRWQGVAPERQGAQPSARVVARSTSDEERVGNPTSSPIRTPLVEPQQPDTSPRLLGRIVDPNGQAVPDARLFVWQGDQRVATVRADAEGRIDETLDPERFEAGAAYHWVAVASRYGTSQPNAPEVYDARSDLIAGDIRVDAREVVEGWLVMSDGLPAPGLHLSARVEGATRSSSNHSIVDHTGAVTRPDGATTDDAGRFRIAVLPDRPADDERGYVLFVNRPAQHPIEIPIPRHSLQRVHQLEGEHVTIINTDVDTRPINFRLWSADRAPDPTTLAEMQRGSQWREAVLDAGRGGTMSDRKRIFLLDAGGVLCVAASRGATYREIVHRAEAPRAILDLAIDSPEPTGRLRVEVVDADRRPLTDFRAHIVSPFRGYIDLNLDHANPVSEVLPTSGPVFVEVYGGPKPPMFLSWRTDPVVRQLAMVPTDRTTHTVTVEVDPHAALFCILDFDRSPEADSSSARFELSGCDGSVPPTLLADFFGDEGWMENPNMTTLPATLADDHALFIARARPGTYHATFSLDGFTTLQAKVELEPHGVHYLRMVLDRGNAGVVDDMTPQRYAELLKERGR